MSLIELKNITRSFKSGETSIQILKGIDLTIQEGEMVAIIGASGSGKSTLMNILGCLDKASSGDYIFHGENIGQYEDDQLAKLRREHFGFIFQRYHLLSTLNAEGNAEVPAIYAGFSPIQRKSRAEALLAALGLQERLKYYPTQLSGGQQQRVSIARALMNGGEVILADEPTGALDSESGQQVLKILQELNQAGHTIILVTHDKDVANHATRIIELKDGEVLEDRPNTPPPIQTSNHEPVHLPQLSQKKNTEWLLLLDRIINAFRMALISMSMQRMRTFLTMLGIIIGIASVVLVIALGQGTMNQILSNINSMGTSTLTIYPGSGFGDARSGRVRSLTPNDVNFLSEQSFIKNVTPVVNTTALARFGNLEKNVSVMGVGTQYFDTEGYTPSEGIFFDEESEENLSLDVVIDEATRDELFADHTNPIGEVITLNRLPMRVIGIATSKNQRSGGYSNLTVFMPYSTAMKRLLGQSYLRNITVTVHDHINMKLAEQTLTTLMIQLHGAKDFFIFTADSFKELVEETTFVMRFLIFSIAMISLVVGGIGVMNIMLVSVAERTKEIGMRMAVGARKSDISMQFLIEAVLVCLLGGCAGILVAYIAGYGINQLELDLSVGFSLISIVVAIGASTAIGVIFGYFPARRAAQLAPIEALERS
ncbi:MacB family efflux pump subunit [Wohlfahrtiimonas larvae]|uniref:Pyoverdine export ATP-binding/permease protein PvdT n=1 Tax=Wohlfahrtiimonas larvae TaxID=1157986 RepID=A0ABP9MPJ6_9GAMM|nr:MacB family efflux pump subunit [Wohlfahrtiimonas larvae]